MKVELFGIRKSFGTVDALRGVSLDIAAGAIVVVLGANGSGKTTLLRAMAGIVAPQKGVISYDGVEFNRDNVELRRRLFFLPDYPHVFWQMTPIQHLGMCLKVYRAHRPGIEERAVQLLRDLEILPLANSPLAALSRGQLYKAALCALILVDPELWLLDEPFASGMDPQGIAVFRQAVVDAAGRGHTVIYTTQLVELAQRLSDRVCFLQHGEVRAYGTFNELRERAERDAELHKLFVSLSDRQ